MHLISISRAGKPKGINAKDYSLVSWIAVDIFKPEEWKSHLKNCIAVIHCVGISEELPEQGLTYERMIYESAKIVAITAKKNGVHKFVYISGWGTV